MHNLNETVTVPVHDMYSWFPEPFRGMEIPDDLNFYFAQVFSTTRMLVGEDTPVVAATVGDSHTFTVYVAVPRSDSATMFGTVHVGQPPPSETSQLTPEIVDAQLDTSSLLGESTGPVVLCGWSLDFLELPYDP